MKSKVGGICLGFTLAIGVAHAIPACPLYEPPASRNVTPPPPFLIPERLFVLATPSWSAYGKMCATKYLREDGQMIYKLEDMSGVFLTYITTNPSKSLAAYVGKTIAVYGPTLGSPNESTHYILASHVAVP